MAVLSRVVLEALARKDAAKYGVDPDIFVRQITQESGFNPAARSSAGAEGIAQFMPGTAAGYHINPYDPVQALDAAARYDASSLRSFGGDYRLALAAYNAGARNAHEWNNPSFAGGQTYNYVRSILGSLPPVQKLAAVASQPPPAAAPSPVPVSGPSQVRLAQAVQALRTLLATSKPVTINPGFAPITLPTPAAAVAAVPAFTSPLLTASYGDPLGGLAAS